jgi:hypothetical protein
MTHRLASILSCHGPEPLSLGTIAAEIRLESW